MTQPCWIVGLLFLLGGFSLVAAEEIDFNRDIRPILSENCFHCHGPDPETREADLRLDEQEASREDLGGYAAVVPGDPEKSEVWLRVAHGEGDDLMPPPDSKRKLTEKQKSLLKQWIESGGEYAKHWAYEAPVRHEGGIDDFVEAQHQKRGYTFSEEAEKWKILRRVSLDLVGLPPTPEELHAFQNDDSPDAYEKVVDRLLASPRFGEKWARSWLDLARYADSNGFQADQLRDSWAYRDWVINALNTNMPFDQFTIEQLAGDLLPDATLDQKIATGFHRTVTCNVEAGVHPEENRTNQVVDRVNTTATVWLGATLECAQCHDHKYDPFSMKDYYGIFAYFNNTPLEVENKSGGGVSFDFYGPKMELPMAPDKEAQRKALQSQRSKARVERDNLKKSLDIEFAAWTRKVADRNANSPEWKVLEIVDFSGSHGETCSPVDDGSVLIKGEIPNSSTYTFKAKLPAGKVGAVRLEMLSDPSLPAKGPARGNGDRPNVIVNEIQATVGGKEIEWSGATADYSQKGWEVAQAIDGDLKNKGWAIGPEFGKDHWAVFELPAREAKADEEWAFSIFQNYGAGRVIGRMRISVAEFAPKEEDLSDDLNAILAKEESKRSKKESTQLRSHFEKNHPQMKAAELKLAKVDKELKAVEPDTTLVMVEMDESRETHIMKRGNYLSPGEKVTAATPELLHPIDPELPANRLGFAKWVMDPANPLVARVTVNRWWAEIFGNGIVRTVEDFGTQSEPPTHPELLDWLAMEFVESGWDMKHVLKQIVMSQTYRQDSKVTPEMVENDPDNRFFARGPRFRLSAETIRDQALVASGLLSTKMGGEPIMPYQPSGMWRQVGRNEPKWVDAKDEHRFRRGIYVVWRRAAPYPSFVNFDAPDRSSCVVGRPRTNTPLQALTLMNDPAYTEMALALVERVLTEKADASLRDQISYAYERVLSRTPETAELEHLLYLIESKKEAFAKDPKTAEELVSGNRSVLEISDTISREDLAAWFYLGNVLLNLDETVTKG